MQQVPCTISVVRMNRFEEFLGHGRISDHIGPDGGDINKNAVDLGVSKGRSVIGRLRSQVSQNQLLSRFPELDQAPDEQEL